MGLLERYLRHPYPILAILILGLVLGLKSFRQLPLNLFPEANYPRILVVLSLPGASAEDVEKEVSSLVERELARLSLVRKVRSFSRDEVAVVSVEFEYEKRLSSAQVDVSAALDRILAELPSGLRPPRIFKVSDATVPVMTVAVSPKEGSGLDLAEIRRLAEGYLRPNLLNVEGIGDVEIFGGLQSEILIEIDRDALARYGLNLAQVASAIWAQNQNIPSGIIRTNQKEIFIKIVGDRLEPERFKELVIPHPGSQSPLNLGDIAEVRLDHSDPRSLFRGNAIPAVALNILRPEDGNVMATIEAAKDALKRLARDWPQLRFSIVDTQEDLIRTSLSNLTGALKEAIFLTVAVIFLLLAKVRGSLLAAISIPTTYLLTFFLMGIFNMELNIVTMTAVILAVGLLVDDSIVVIENIERHIRNKGLSPKEAAISGTREIMLADLSGTFTTILVLIPIMFVGGYVEKILRELALVLTMALSASYLVSVTIIPLLAPYLLSQKGPEPFLERLLKKINQAFLDRLQALYLNLFRFGIGHKVLFLAPALILLVVSGQKIAPLVGRDLMPPMDTGILKVAFEVSANTPTETAAEIIQEMENLIKAQPGLLRLATVLGTEPEAISFGADRTPRQGLITAHFVNRFQRQESIWEIEDNLYQDILKIPGLKSVHVYEFGATPLSSIAAPVDVRVSGRDPEIIHQVAQEIKERLYRVRGVASLSQSWDFDRLEYQILFDQERLARHGLSPEEVARFIVSGLSGRQASVWRLPEEGPRPVSVRFPREDRASLEDLLDILIPAPQGPLPLREVARVEERFVRGAIIREDLIPAIDILGYRRQAAISHIQAGVEEALRGLDLPAGVKISQEGEIHPMKEAFGRLKKALVISLILLYFSLVPTFGSFRVPLTIMVAIPLALIGAIWGLLLAGRHFCMPASMGMILLSGVVVNNSILLIDFIQKARNKGAELYLAVEESIRARTRPILMTALSTIAGMIPIAAERAVGLERLSPLAVVAIGGLLVATILTLVYVPLLYCLFEEWSRAVHRLFKREEKERSTGEA
ncbi:efflux RND transporter permease subunit [Thermosulfuriphilus sp.]